MRLPNWQLLLAAEVEAWRFRPFAYGTSDCWQFVGSAVLAMTGVDYRDRFPRYGSHREALRILAASGGMYGIAESTFGPSKPPAHACEGDVVIGDFGLGPTAGICLGVNFAAPGEAGLVFLKASAVSSAWSI